MKQVNMSGEDAIIKLPFSYRPMIYYAQCVFFFPSMCLLWTLRMWRMDEGRFHMTPASPSLAPSVVCPMLFCLYFLTISQVVYEANMSTEAVSPGKLAYIDNMLVKRSKQVQTICIKSYLKSPQGTNGYWWCLSRFNRCRALLSGLQ